MNKDGTVIVINLLIKKFGIEKIEGLLTGEWAIEKERPVNRSKYTRQFKRGEEVLDDCGHNISPDLILLALEDARENLNYSNWHGDKFDRAAEMVIRYCEEHKISIDYAYPKGN